jgi:transcriptional regulator of acetoin/glycerol metabolism
VRELAHALEHAVLFAPQERIDLPHLPTHLSQPAPAASNLMPEQPSSNRVPISHGGLRGGLREAPTGGSRTNLGLSEAFAETAEHEAAFSLSFEENIKQALLRSLRESKGNRCLAASLLGVSRSTLYRMMWRHGLGDSFKTLSGYRHRRSRQNRQNLTAGPNQAT